MTSLASRFRQSVMALLVGGGCLLSQAQAADLPPNIANGLRNLIAANSLQPNVKLNAARLAVNSATNRVELVPGKSNFISDPQNRVLVRVILNGTLDAAAVSSEIEKSGGKVVATSAYGRGVIGAFIPLANAAAIASLAGVQALHLTYKPIQNVGAVTAQSVGALDVNKVLAQGINGKHVTVGIISDTYNESGGKDTAATDVASGDLPNTTKIKGGEGLKALIQDDFNGGTDEGRGMAQIIHDMAPGADLCFATGDFGQEGFAANIYALASDQGPCKADIILDDQFYFAEPFFSDGLIAAAVDRVGTTPRSDGSRVTYLSAAGNEQDAGYDAFFNRSPRRMR